MNHLELQNNITNRPVLQFSRHPKINRDSQPCNPSQKNPLSLTLSSNYDSANQSKILNTQRNSSSVLYFPTRSQPKENIYYVSKLLRNQQNKDSIVMKHLVSSWKISKQYINLSFQNPITQLDLPQKEEYRNKKILVFDMDQTLIHSTKSQDITCDIRIPMYFPNGEFINAGINIRPHALEMLQRLSHDFQIIIFTASHSYYADPILNVLDPENKIFQHRLYREHCTEINKHTYVKDLRIIPRDLHKMVLIDNSPITYIPQIQNGIPIISYYQGKDKQLKQLQQYLMKLSEVEDVRQLNKITFKLNQYKKFQNVEDLIQQLYVSQQ